jgi:alkyl hydroperoxide reductase subunit AhpC
VFVIDAKGIVRLTLTYPAATGRDFEEILRVIDSLQLTDSHRVATPVNWRPGGDCVVLPAITDAEADTLFPKGYRKLTPYLRMTPDPVGAK